MTEHAYEQHGDDHEDQLLEYETEQEAPVVTLPVPVCVTEPVVTIPTVPQHVTTYTVVTAIGTDNGVEVLLPQDPLRVRATIYTADQPVVICHTLQQATSSANQVTSVPSPSGAYLPTGLVVTICGTQQMWVAATSATPTRVTVITERRTP